MELLLIVMLVTFTLIYLFLPKASGSIPRSPTKFEFIGSCLPNSLIRTEESTPDFYCINIPVRVYNLHTINGLKRIHFDLIYYSLYKGEFSAGEGTISHNLNELHEIFQSAIQKNKPTIYINLLG